MERRRIIKRGRLEDKWKTRYFVEIDETGERHKYVFGPGFLGEIDERTRDFHLIDFCAPSLSKELAPALNEPWPDHEILISEPESST
jgi:hypothetical protein